MTALCFQDREKWVIGHGLVWPAANNDAAVLFLPFWSWTGHMVYGLVLGLVLLATRRGCTS